MYSTYSYACAKKKKSMHQWHWCLPMSAGTNDPINISSQSERVFESFGKFLWHTWLLQWQHKPGDSHSRMWILRVVFSGSCNVPVFISKHFLKKNNQADQHNDRLNSDRPVVDSLLHQVSAKDLLECHLHLSFCFCLYCKIYIYI